MAWRHDLLMPDMARIVIDGQPHLFTEFPAQGGKVSPSSTPPPVARILFSVAAEAGVPNAWCWRMIVVNIACTCATDSSASSTCPRYGARYRRTCAA
jgi:hypothetical protein